MTIQNQATIYNTPDVYNKETGLYNGAGVYKDGEGGGDIKEVEIGNIIYPVAHLGSLYIISKPLKNEIGDFLYVNGDMSNTDRYGLIYKNTAMPLIGQILPSDWRFMTRDDSLYLKDNFNYIDLLSSDNDLWGGLGTNATGLNIVPAGGYNYGNGYENFGTNFEAWTSTIAHIDALERLYQFIVNLNGIYTDSAGAVVSNYRSILVVKDA